MALEARAPAATPPRPMALQAYRHRLPAHVDVVPRSILGGPHHDERLEKKAASSCRQHGGGPQANP
jgi:hypothetical protein